MKHPRHRREKQNNDTGKRYYNTERHGNYPQCPICGKSIRDLYSAVNYAKTNTPAHFDCIVKELKETNDLRPDEKICYLGDGSFGIVQFRGPDSPIRFFIRKRIQYESKEEKPEWRQNLPLSTI